MNYTDNQLKAALAKMLPEQIKLRQFTDDIAEYGYIYWKNKNQHPLQSEVRDTELLHLCWLVEEAMPYSREWVDYTNILAADAISATWQQRIIALAKVKGIEI